MKVNQKKFQNEKKEIVFKAPEQTKGFTEDVVSIGDNQPLPKSPQFFPITLPDQPREAYSDMEKKVTDLEQNHPPKLEKVWEKVSKDGEISVADKKKLDRAMGDLVIGSHTVINSTDTEDALYIKAWLDMDKKGSVKMNPEVRQAYTKELKEREDRLSKGEILTGCFIADGLMHELTEGIISTPYNQFVEREKSCRMKPEDWGICLANYRGGQVKVTERDTEGKPIKQIERMVIETPLSKLFSKFDPLDMTKIETITYGDDKSKVSWEVLKSDNDTVLKDIGSVAFEPFGENQTKITFHSAHQLNNFPANLDLSSVSPLEKLRDKLVAKSLRDSFVAFIEHYRELAG